jgi:hypothetical protein
MFCNLKFPLCNLNFTDDALLPHPPALSAPADHIYPLSILMSLRAQRSNLPINRGDR